MKEVKEHLKRKVEECKRYAEQNERDAADYSKAAAREIESATLHRRMAAEYQALADAQPE